jgi:hypothetical protein
MNEPRAVRRYHPEFSCGEGGSYPCASMEEDSDGEWVSYEDYVKLLKSIVPEPCGHSIIQPNLAGELFCIECGEPMP